MKTSLHLWLLNLISCVRNSESCFNNFKAAFCNRPWQSLWFPTQQAKLRGNGIELRYWGTGVLNTAPTPKGIAVRLRISIQSKKAFPFCHFERSADVCLIVFYDGSGDEKSLRVNLKSKRELLAWWILRDFSSPLPTSSLCILSQRYARNDKKGEGLVLFQLSANPMQRKTKTEKAWMLFYCLSGALPNDKETRQHLKIRRKRAILFCHSNEELMYHETFFIEAKISH